LIDFWSSAGTVGNSSAFSFVVGFNALLVFGAAFESGFPMCFVNRAAHMSLIAANLHQEVRRWQVVGWERAPHVGRSSATAELRRPAALEVIVWRSVDQ